MIERMVERQLAEAAGQLLSGWNLAPAVDLPLLAAGALYWLGVRRLTRRPSAPRWPTSRSRSFAAGLAVLFVALVSPLDGYADRRLSVHMVQHLLLMQIAPPLLLLGRPVTLALAASPLAVRPRLARLAHGRIARFIGSPAVGFGSLVAVLWVWHLTPLYASAVSDPMLHALEHLVFVAAALSFWWPVVARDPGSARLSHPARVLYLFLSMPAMSLLGFVIAATDRVLYAPYAAVLGPASALADQRLAGTIMWESSTLVSVVALSAVLWDWMARDERDARRADLRRVRESVPATDGSIVEGR
jgi:putative membrane protein